MSCREALVALGVGDIRRLVAGDLERDLAHAPRTVIAPRDQLQAVAAGPFAAPLCETAVPGEML